MVFVFNSSFIQKLQYRSFLSILHCVISNTLSLKNMLHEFNIYILNLIKMGTHYLQIGLHKIVNNGFSKFNPTILELDIEANIFFVLHSTRFKISPSINYNSNLLAYV